MINKGADVNQLIEEKPILHRAVFSKEIDFVKFLLKKGAKINAVDSKGKTALIMALPIGCKEAIDILLEVGADVNVSSFDGNTALSIAVEDENDEYWEFAKKLINKELRLIREWHLIKSYKLCYQVVK